MIQTKNKDYDPRNVLLEMAENQNSPLLGAGEAQSPMLPAEDVLGYTTHQTGSYPVFMPKQMPQSVRNYKSNRFNISSARTKVLTTSQVRFNSQKGGSRPHIRLHSNSPATSDTQLLAEGKNYLKSQRKHQQVGPSAHEL